MADTDHSINNLRYNFVTQGLEGFGGGSPMWTPLNLGSHAQVIPQVVVQRDILTSAAVTTTTYIPVGPIATISLQKSTNRVSITAFGTVFNVVLNGAGENGWGGDFTIMRDGTTNLAVLGGINGDCLARMESVYPADAGTLLIEQPIMLPDIIDTPGDTSAHTYQMYAKVTASQVGGGTQFNVGDTGTTRSIVLQEILS